MNVYKGNFVSSCQEMAWMEKPVDGSCLGLTENPNISCQGRPQSYVFGSHLLPPSLRADFATMFLLIFKTKKVQETAAEAKRAETQKPTE